SSKVSAILITHHDIDHIGALAEWKQAYPHCKILAPIEEAPYLKGTKRSLRLQQAEQLYDSLPDQEKPAALHFQKFLESVQPVSVDQELLPGAVLPYCGGLEVVPTPGHLPGHISFYARSSKILIAGDAVVIDADRLDLANPAYAIDLKAAVTSVELLMQYDIEQLLCYHGGVWTTAIKNNLAQLVDRYRSQSA
ncbi:MAG TPA: MBL fold metallo-hydrolase, partial [Flavisolibacter sp.]|nr:MBL fold metallo-hydrolase [Flavisolibacter sp.]